MNAWAQQSLQSKQWLKSYEGLKLMDLKVIKLK
jgi:hypothetical protein